MWLSLNNKAACWQEVGPLCPRGVCGGWEKLLGVWGGGGGRGGDHAVCVLSWQRWCVIRRGKKKGSPRRRKWGLECVYLTRPAPTHPWPPSQFPGWGPDLGDVSPLSRGFCRSHYHLTHWGVSKRMELKLGSP